MAQLAFVGGTALRILYKLPRFSEDLDFSQVEDDFDFLDLLHFIKKELGLYGFSLAVTKKIREHGKKQFYQIWRTFVWLEFVSPCKSDIVYQAGGGYKSAKWIFDANICYTQRILFADSAF